MSADMDVVPKKDAKQPTVAGISIVPKNDAKHLRELAKKQMEYARLPVMERRAQNWLRLNTGKPAIPPVVVEAWSFEPDLLPSTIFRCESEAGREIE